MPAGPAVQWQTSQQQQQQQRQSSVCQVGCPCIITALGMTAQSDWCVAECMCGRAQVLHAVYSCSCCCRHQPSAQLDSWQHGGSRGDDRWRLAASAASLESPPTPLSTQPAKPVSAALHAILFNHSNMLTSPLKHPAIAAGLATSAGLAHDVMVSMQALPRMLQRLTASARAVLWQVAEKVGVLLLNLGGPETLDDVQPFLYNLFADPDIIRLPDYAKFLQPVVAQVSSHRRAMHFTVPDAVAAVSPVAVRAIMLTTCNCWHLQPDTCVVAVWQMSDLYAAGDFVAACAKELGGLPCHWRRLPTAAHHTGAGRCSGGGARCARSGGQRVCGHALLEALHRGRCGTGEENGRAVRQLQTSRPVGLRTHF